MEPDQLLAHLRRGTLEFCVLAALRRGERYALDLVHDLGRDGTLLTSEGTLYPLLSRLRRDGLVSTEWRESPSGPPRRYYNVTPAGRAALAAFESQWRRWVAAVDAVLEGAQP
jgi:PadR family transcriptional regulator, regulatory protein PadR